MQIFLTGGSGFVGGHLIEALSRAHDVRAMAPSPACVELVRRYGATPVASTLQSVEPEQLMGTEVVIHAGALVQDWGSRRDFFDTNVLGTERLLRAAREAGVRRFVHIGTDAVLFGGRDLTNVTEAQEYAAHHLSLYAASKAQAEQRVLASATSDFVCLALRPRLVWGPRDPTLLPALVSAVQTGDFAWVDGGRARTWVTHVRNLVEAVRLALERGRGGESYFVADAEQWTFRELFSALLKTQGLSAPEREVSSGIALPVARIVEGCYRLLGVAKRPPLTAQSIALVARSYTVDASKASRELGYEPVMSAERGLAELPRVAPETPPLAATARAHLSRPPPA